MNVAIIPHSLAAFFLQQAVFTLFLRLVWWTAPSPSTLNRRTLWFSPRVGFYFMSGTLFLLAVVQAVPIPIFVFCGLIAQMILLAVFLAFVGRVWTVSRGWAGLVQGERLPGAWRRKGLVGVWAMSGLLMVSVTIRAGARLLERLWCDELLLTRALDAAPYYPLLDLRPPRRSRVVLERLSLRYAAVAGLLHPHRLPPPRHVYARRLHPPPHG